MTSQSRRRLLGSAAGAVTAASLPSILARPAFAAAPALEPRKLPVPPNDDFGAYEPTLSADGNTIYFARFGNNGDTRVKGPTDIFVTHRVNQGGEWPGSAGDWSAPERLPDTVNSESLEQEPWITPDGSTLYFMSGRQAPGVGANGVYFSKRLPSGEWGQAEPLAVGNINLADTITHCFLAFDLPGEAPAYTFISIRPREPGGPPSPDIYTTHAVDGGFEPAKRYADRLLDSIANKCRFNVVTHDGFTLGVVSVHDFGKFHTLLFVQYDPKSKEWKGPIVEAPFNDWNIDGACPHFQANGERMIWAAGYDRGPDIISGSANDTGGVYDLFWLPTSEIVAYYKARAGVA